jgi:hypothetical protein
MTNIMTVNDSTARCASLITFALSLVLGCARAGSESGDEPAPGVTRQAQVVAKTVGDACEESDGWTPEPIPVPAGSPDPVVVPVPAGYIDYPQIKPGIGYCIRKGPGNPYGYYTMNCAADTDCPQPSRCDKSTDWGRCRAPCTKDLDCVSPMTCRSVSDPSQVRYCMDSVALRVAQHS